MPTKIIYDEPQPLRLDPEHPPVGEDHVIAAPNVPPPIPISSGNAVRHTLVIGDIALLATEPCRDFMLRLRETRENSAMARARHPVINVVADAERRYLAACREQKCEPGKRMRGKRLFPTPAAQHLFQQAYVAAKHDLELFFWGAGVPQARRVNATPIQTAVMMVEQPTLRQRADTVLPGERYATDYFERYDEILMLVPLARSRDLIRRWGRNPKTWIVTFDPDPTA